MKKDFYVWFWVVLAIISIGYRYIVAVTEVEIWGSTILAMIYLGLAMLTFVGFEIEDIKCKLKKRRK